MKNSLNKYKLLSIAVLSAASAKSDVIYTDVDPDLTYTENADEYLLDFDLNGTVDVKISNLSSSTSGSFFGYSFSAQQNGVTIDPYGNGVIAGQYYSFTSSGTNTNTELRPLRANEAISGSQSFISSTAGTLFQFNKNFIGAGGVPLFSNSGYSGNFKDTVYDKFIGVKFKEGQKEMYGWVRVGITAAQGSQSFTIFDYAYEDSLSSIYSGQGIISPGTLSLDKEIFGSKIFVSQKTLYVESETAIKGYISIVNLNGKEVYNFNINGDKGNVNLDHLKSKSIYIVRLITNEGTQSKKIFLD